MTTFDSEHNEHSESIAAIIRDIDARPNGTAAADHSVLPDPIDWDVLWAREPHTDWLVEDFWPVGRQLHIFAAQKSKKSLVTLWIAGSLAAGRDPFTGAHRDPVTTTYLDHEMTEDDVLERLEAMGFKPADLAALRYYLLPSMPPLDTPEGGARLMQLIQRDQSQAVVIDTLSRVVKGEENSNDTYQDFYAWTGRLLKQAGVSLIRLDHEGHAPGRSRGGSAKGDDVDVVWRLQATEDGLAFVRKASRISWVPERVDLKQVDDPTLSFSTGLQSWPAGTKAKAGELDEIGAPINVSKRQAIQLLKDAGREVGRHDLLLKAIKYRLCRLPQIGNHLGNHPETGLGTSDGNHPPNHPSTCGYHQPEPPGTTQAV